MPVAACVRQPLKHAACPTPSAHPVPSAAAENDLHRPSGASPRCRENSTNAPGVAITVTPPASASEHSPDRSAWAARCIATSDDEHAVSTVTAGPFKPEHVRHPAGDHAARCPVSR